MADENGQAMKKNNSTHSALDPEADLEDDLEMIAEEEEFNQFHWSKCCYNLPEWAQLILYAFFGSLILLSPLIVIVCLDPRIDFLDPNPSNPDDTRYIKPYVARWSLFLTLCWISELIIWRIIGILPNIITSLVMFFTNKSNEKLQTIAEFIVALRLWATWAVWMIVVQALFTVFFQNNVPGGTLPTDVSVTGQYSLLGSLITTVMVFSVVVFIQKFFMHSIAVNFHRSAYASRIDKSKKHVRYMDKMRKSLKRFAIKISPTSKTMDSNGNLRNGSITNAYSRTSHSTTKKLHDVVEDPDQNPDPAEKVHLNIEIEPTKDEKPEPTKDGKSAKSYGKFLRRPSYKSWKSFFPSAPAKLEFTSNLVSGDVANDRQAKRLAKQLFESMKRSDRDELYLDDFEKYFEKSVAKEVYAIFDSDMNGNITQYELKKGIVEIYRERRGIFRSLQGFSKSFSKLENVFWFISAIITCLIVLPTWGISLTAILPLTSVFIALGIIVGGALRTMFDCIIFLFAYHPYDAGDRVMIEGDYMIVDNFELLTTSFIKGDGSVLIIPNAILATKFIQNIRRSGDQTEGIELIVDFYTPQELLNELQRRMLEYVKSKGREFHPSCDFTILEVQNMNALKCKFFLKFKGNWQDMGSKGQRRRDFMYELIKNLKELDISYSKPSHKEEGIHEKRKKDSIFHAEEFEIDEPDTQSQADDT